MWRAAGLWLLLVGFATTAAALTPETRAGLLALDPDRVSDRQVQELLSQAPVPRVLLFKGSLGADMESFGAFLKQMGYPAHRLRNPATGGYSYSLSWSGCRCDECDALAAGLPAQARRDGVAPMLVAHSGGGVTLSRILHRLAADADAPRVLFAATLGTGGLMRLVPGFPGCAAELPKLSQVPASAAAFTGYRIDGDPFTALLGIGDFHPAEGQAPAAQVRNVLLPWQVSHLRAFEVDGYAAQPQVRAWIEAYQPGSDAPLPEATGLDLGNLRHIADLWHSLKKHWALQARQWAVQAGD
jgi:hypothetical protein